MCLQGDGDGGPLAAANRSLRIDPIGQTGSVAIVARRTAEPRDDAIARIHELDPRINGVVFPGLGFGGGGHGLPFLTAVGGLEYRFARAHRESMCRVEEEYAQNAWRELAYPFPGAAAFDRLPKALRAYDPAVGIVQQKKGQWRLSQRDQRPMRSAIARDHGSGAAGSLLRFDGSRGHAAPRGRAFQIA